MEELESRRSEIKYLKTPELYIFFINRSSPGKCGVARLDHGENETTNAEEGANEAPEPPVDGPYTWELQAQSSS
jgi:hypothetical protein